MTGRTQDVFPPSFSLMKHGMELLNEKWDQIAAELRQRTAKKIILC